MTENHSTIADLLRHAATMPGCASCDADVSMTSDGGTPGIFHVEVAHAPGCPEQRVRDRKTRRANRARRTARHNGKYTR
ncbi:hypothetical protein ABH922_001254 [Rhodococcus sp. 27YEA15]|uniref:hypothetical protein n=1 Tax=Rhodococcus sp. 27YEA15 TaxID=3156259 RepID=UPI003C79B8BE